MIKKQHFVALLASLALVLSGCETTDPVPEAFSSMMEENTVIELFDQAGMGGSINLPDKEKTDEDEENPDDNTSDDKTSETSDSKDTDENESEETGKATETESGESETETEENSEDDTKPSQSTVKTDEQKSDDTTKSDDQKSDDTTKEDEQKSDDTTKDDEQKSDDTTKTDDQKSDDTTKDDEQKSDDTTKTDDQKSDDTTKDDEQKSDDTTKTDDQKSDDTTKDDEQKSDDTTKTDDQKSDDTTKDDEQKSDDTTKTDDQKSDDTTKDDEQKSDDTTKTDDQKSDDTTKDDEQKSDDTTKTDDQKSDDTTKDDEQKSDDTTKTDDQKTEDTTKDDEQKSDDTTKTDDQKTEDTAQTDEQKTEDTTEEVPEKDYSTNNKILMQKVEAARQAAIDAGASSAAKTVWTATEGIYKTEKAAVDSGTKADLSQVLNDLLARYQGLENLAQAKELKEEIDANNLASFRQGTYDAGNAIYKDLTNPLSVVQSGADFNQKATTAEADFRLVLKTAYSALAKDERTAAYNAKLKADSVKAYVSRKDEYTHAVSLYRNGELRRSVDPKVANESYKMSKEEFLKLFEEISAARAQAQKEIDEAKKRVAHSETTAVKADAEAPLGDEPVEGIEDADAKLLKDDDFSDAETAAEIEAPVDESTVGAEQ
ncbi:MAG: hypothetical protein IKR40_07805 [Treponema sp.]|nr:hypothetical protein [Treponema sp.]